PKMSIVLAGPGFNLLFAVLLAISSFALYGKIVPVDSPIIGDVIPGYPAEKAKLKSKDRIISIDGKEMKTWDEMAHTVALSEGKPIVMHIRREIDEQPNQFAEFDLTIAGEPESPELAMLNDNAPPVPVKSYKVGIVPDIKREPVSLSEAVFFGCDHVWF